MSQWHQIGLKERYGVAQSASKTLLDDGSDEQRQIVRFGAGHVHELKPMQGEATAKPVPRPLGFSRALSGWFV
jgi:hypothetical protein